MDYPPISLVIPVYNEARGIEKVIRDYYQEVISKVPGSELIIAEDGSRDGTKDVLAKLQKEIPFTLVSGVERKGYTRAVKDALALPKTDIIFFSDSDGQHDPKDFFKLLPYINEYDIVIGWKKPRRDPFHRNFISWGYNKLIGFIFGLWMHDIDCGFRLIRKKLLDDVLSETVTLKECVSSEYVVRAYLKGYKVCEVPVTHFPREFGTTSIFSPLKLPGICWGLFMGLLEIRREHRIRTRSSGGKKI